MNADAVKTTICWGIVCESIHLFCFTCEFIVIQSILIPHQQIECIRSC